MSWGVPIATEYPINPGYGVSLEMIDRKTGYFNVDDTMTEVPRSPDCALVCPGLSSKSAIVRKAPTAHTTNCLYW